MYCFLCNVKILVDICYGVFSVYCVPDRDVATFGLGAMAPQFFLKYIIIYMCTNFSNFVL